MVDMRKRSMTNFKGLVTLTPFFSDLNSPVLGTLIGGG